MADAELYRLAEKVGIALKDEGLMLATAESCTGGWIGEIITAVPGSSEWFDRGFITYSNNSKQEILGVQEDTLTKFGAVSEETVIEMAVGAAQSAKLKVALSVSGIAGPGGALPGKPIGMVCFAWKVKDKTESKTDYFAGDRSQVRYQAVVYSLQGLLDRL